MTNKDYLEMLAARVDGSLQAWFDAEHADAEKERDAWRMAASGPIYEATQERDRMRVERDELARKLGECMAERDLLQAELDELRWEAMA